MTYRHCSYNEIQLDSHFSEFYYDGINDVATVALAVVLISYYSTILR